MGVADLKRSPSGLTIDEAVQQVMEAGEIFQYPRCEMLSAMATQIQAERRVLELTEDIWMEISNTIKPKLIKNNWILFAESGEPLRLMWVMRGKYFCKQLSWPETFLICEASGLPKNYT